MVQKACVSNTENEIHLPPDTGSKQYFPQRCLQHFSLPGQLKSVVHISTQTPKAVGGGHMPGFTSALGNQKLLTLY